MTRIGADADVCIASGQCTRLAPGLFGRDEDGAVSVDDHELTDPEERELAAEAVRACPAGALWLYEPEDEPPVR